METNVIYHMDCVCGMSEKLEEGSVDLILADPPREGVEDGKWIPAATRTLRSGGSLYLFASLSRFCRMYPLLMECGMELKGQILITKGASDTPVGRRSGKSFPATVDSVFLLCKDPRPFVSTFLKERQKELGISSKEINLRLGVKTNGGGMWSHYTGRLAVKQLPTKAVWKKLSEILQFDLPYSRITQTFHPKQGLTDLWNDLRLREEKDRLHPAQKTQKLLTRLICASTDENDLVLDPFMGSGSTAEACLYNGRRFVGFELNEKYCKMAIERIANQQFTMF